MDVVVVGEYQVRGFLGQVCPDLAHRDPDVRGLEGGCVVDAVPDHGHRVAVLLKETDQSLLLRRGDAGEYPDSG